MAETWFNASLASRSIRSLRRCVTLAVLCWLGVSATASALTFRIRFENAVTPGPFTGRVLVFLGRPGSQPRRGPDWFHPKPIVSRDVRDWRAGESLLIGEKNSLAFPKPLSELPAGRYAAQPVMDFDLGPRTVGDGPGNGFGHPREIRLGPGSEDSVVDLVIDQVVPEKPFAQTPRVRYFEASSRLLSEFHGKRMRMRAGVVLPASYDSEPRRLYPTVFFIPGFTGTHHRAVIRNRLDSTNVAGEEMLVVVLDPECRLGHHVFADSANNGPVGTALVEEFLPAFERAFRAIPRAEARFLRGHSSGGWSSLWLQITFPETFGGAWSTAPDPVDFRDFQQIDLYKPDQNLFVDAQGRPRPLARRGGRPILFMRDFSDLERVLGRGGQLGSFEAVFSPRGPNDEPARLWDRETGAIDHAVAREWSRYDIRLLLERNHESLAPRLRGKIHVFMGELDTFYLEGATRLLKRSLAALDYDAVVELVPRRDHRTLLDPSLEERIRREIADAFRQGRTGTR